MIEKIKQFIDTHNLISAQTKHVFAAVSGGVDSTVLLDILYQLIPEYSYQLHIIHFNHRTRGKESEGDERFVEKLSKKYEIDIKIGSLDSTVYKMTETALREERYKFFASCCVMVLPPSTILPFWKFLIIARAIP